MTDNHPITPPPELVQRLRREAPHGIRDAGVTRELHLIHAAYRWGWGLRGEANEAELQKARDGELEACCEWLINNQNPRWAAALQEGRRPKPQTLNSIALQMLDTIERDAHYIPEITDTIRRALEQLPDDQG